MAAMISDWIIWRLENGKETLEKTRSARERCLFWSWFVFGSETQFFAQASLETRKCKDNPLES